MNQPITVSHPAEKCMSRNWW